MIILDHVCKDYPTRSGKRKILRDINVEINPGERIGILGRNGSGKSTLLRLLSGAEAPTSGSVIRKMNVSWPLAFGGAFQSSLTGMDNLRFICRLYGVQLEEQLDFVESFTELGPYLREPVKRYSAGMRARLSFALSLAVDFDCYLIDEIIAVGDSRFHEKCHYELFERRGDRTYVVVSHDPGLVGRYCQRAAVLKNGNLTEFSAISDAYNFYLE
ncbi:ABC transporter ATP-binding protein [Paraburkholderia bonniea]|uniref:ABC transporter ATP-binding protein n=1 Tax=Paraburkholderia bonniea TaxID=2152891 RepID=UPI0012911EDE|nr:ABC transporter ATP-binding protein [Paraburkholderia bonniea]WJF90812.1 ABC transporter ATP-binding protein [Paraburkholderia bonniea]WJF94126.1 ABC transporter ATP-binding protein [Paraburkholderia bonniea]